jgi:hypothetical protein
MSHVWRRPHKSGLYVLMGEIYGWFFTEGVRVYRRFKSSIILWVQG